MAAPQYNEDHKRARKTLIALLAITGPWPCPRCGKPMTVFMKLDLGHSVDVALGGFGSPRRLEHSRCNRRAGGQRAVEMREGKRAAVRSPEEKAAHDHRDAVRKRRAFREWDEQQAEHGREW